jgi:hypothetical protein
LDLGPAVREGDIRPARREARQGAARTGP